MLESLKQRMIGSMKFNGNYFLFMTNSHKLFIHELNFKFSYIVLVTPFR